MSPVSRVPASAPARIRVPYIGDPDPVPGDWMPWSPIGPSVVAGPHVVLDGPSSARLPARLGGRVRALAVSPDGQRVYAGTASGGVWYSEDAGARWTALDLYESALNVADQAVHVDALTVGAIAVHWATRDTDVVYVAAGVHPAPPLAQAPETLQDVGVRFCVGPAERAMATGTAANVPWRAVASNLRGVAVNRLMVDRVAQVVVWAATTRGLYRRHEDGRDEWEAIDTGLGDGEMSDVLVVAPGVGAEAERVYAAHAAGRVAWSSDGAHWTPVALPAFAPADLAPNARNEPIGRVRLAAGYLAGHVVVYAVANGPRLWRIDGGAAAIVRGLPLDLFDGDGVSDPSSMAIAAWPMPDRPDVIAVGGIAFGRLRGPEQAAEAALYMGQLVPDGAGGFTFPRAAVAAGALPAEWIGQELPPGVQELVWQEEMPAVLPPGPPRLWIGGEGGVFRSDAVPDPRGTFAPRNTGLTVVEARSLAQDGDDGAVMLLGTRASGVLRRLSGETWEVAVPGPAGCVAIDPRDGRTMYAQSSGVRWMKSTDGGRTFAALGFLSPADARARDTEDDRSARAMRPAVANLDDAHGTQVALGTHRIWYTDDRSPDAWVTLPANTNPFNPLVANPLAQDALDGAVLAAHWGTANRLYVLTRGGVYLLERNAAGAWQRQQLYDQAAVRRNWKGKIPRGMIPDDQPLAALAVHRADQGLGNLYAGTALRGDVGPVWWFDGDHAWIDTGFAIDAPVHALLVDPAHLEWVYAGTDLGVWQGIGTFRGGAAPVWDWTRHLSAALPEAPCVDLAIATTSGQRVLRAVLAGRGVWEVPLERAVVTPTIYVRSHVFDARLADVPSGGARDPSGAARGQVALDASPDVRVWRSPAADPPEPVAVPLDANSDPFDVWRMRSALRVRGERVDPDAPWLPDGPPALARQAAALPPVAPPRTDLQVWHDLTVGNRFPLDADAPDHADLVVHLRDEPDRWPKGTRTSCVSGDAVGSARARVYVTVHSRHWLPIAPNTVQVALLRTEHHRHRSANGTPALPGGWAASLAADRPAGAGAWLAGTMWAYADPAVPFRTVSTTLDAHNPQIVAFDVDLTGASWNHPGLLLLAVVVTNADLLPAALGTDVAALVRTDHRVAARSVRHAALLVTPLTVYGGFDAGRYPNQAALEQAWNNSNLMFTGLYLDSPLHVAAERDQLAQIPTVVPAGTPVLGFFRGHNRLGNDPFPVSPNAWMRAWNEIRPHWGVMPIYFGQQDHRNGDFVNNPAPPPAMAWRPKGPYDLRAEIGVDNADDAQVKAVAAHIPAGAVIYLDYEFAGAPIGAFAAAMGPMVEGGVAYCNAFFHRLAELGYRPGVYSHATTSPSFDSECPGLFVWNVNTDRTVPAPANATVVRNQLVIRTPPMNVIGEAPDPRAIVRQWRLDFGAPPAPPVNPSPLIFAAINQNHIDADVALVADPAFPERRSKARDIPWGRVAVTPVAAGQCAIHVVRRGTPRRRTWPAGGFPAALLLPHNESHTWNPFTAMIALRVAGPPAAPNDTTELLVAMGHADAESDDVWRLQAVRRPPNRTTWLHETVPDAGFAIDPLPGVAAVTRGDQSIDAFVVDDDTGQLSVARWMPDTRAWHAATNIAGATVKRTSRAAAISHTQGIADVFWIEAADTSLVQTSHSDALTPNDWSGPAPLGGPAGLQIAPGATVRAHPFANVAAVSASAGRIDVFFIGRQDGVDDWRLYDAWWTPAAGWAAANVQFENLDAAGNIVDLEPLAPIAACLRDATHVDVFVVGMDGQMYTQALDVAVGTLGRLTLITLAPPVAGGPPPPGSFATVDGACTNRPGDVQVVATDRTGAVYATSWNAAAGNYDPLVAVPV
jgi:hypothetical protein